MTAAAKGAQLARLTQAYDALDAAGRQLADVLSVLVMPVTRPILQSCLLAAEGGAVGRSEWTDKRLNALVGGLLGRGLVEEVEKKKKRCLPFFREIPIRRAAREGRLARLATAVRMALQQHEPWHERLSRAAQTLEPVHEAVHAYANDLWKKQGRKTPLAIRGLLAEQEILRGHLDEALALVEGTDGDQAGGVASIDHCRVRPQFLRPILSSPTKLPAQFES